MHHTIAHNVHTYTLPQPPSSFCGSSLPSILHAAPLSECASARGVRRARHRQWAIASAALAVTPAPPAPGRHRTQNKTYPSRPRANPTSMWRATPNAIAKSRTRQGGIYSPIAMSHPAKSGSTSSNATPCTVPQIHMNSCTSMRT